MRRRPLLNLLVVSPKGEMFLKAVDTGGETKDAAYIVGQLIDYIREVSADIVIQVVINNAVVCKLLASWLSKSSLG